MTPNAPVRLLTRLTGSVWIWPALIAAYVGFHRLTTPEMWRDEVSTWTASTRSLGELLRMLQHIDASNGAYYILMHGWTTLFGDSPTALRLPSVLAMAGAAAFAALTAQRLFDSRIAGLASGLLLATIPTYTRYAQEARAYALVTCAVAASVWMLLRALDRPSVGRWAAYSACLALAGTVHLISLTTLSGQSLLVLLHLWSTRHAVNRRLLWQFPLAVLVALLPAVPVVVLGTQQSGNQLGWILTPTLHDLRTFGTVLFASRTVFQAFWVIALATLLWPGRRLAAVQALGLAVLPVFAVWVASQGHTSYFIDRYLLFTLPAWAALAGGGVGAIYAGARRLTPVPVGVALAIVVIAVPAWRALPTQRLVRVTFGHEFWTDYRSAAGVIEDGFRPGDGLVAPRGGSNWAMTGPALVFNLPRDMHPYLVFVRSSAAKAESLYEAECAVPAECVGTSSRIWMVTGGNGVPDPFQTLPPAQAEALRAHYAPVSAKEVKGLTVTLLQRTG